MQKHFSVFSKISIRKLHWEKILAVDIFRFLRHEEFKSYSLRKGPHKRMTFGMIRYYFRELITTRPVLPQELSANGKRIDFLFFKSLPREDYDEFFYQVIGALQQKEIAVYNGHEIKKGYNPRALFLFFRHISALFLLIRNLGSHTGVFFYCKMMGYLNVLDLLRRINPTNVVVFADMHPLDNLVVQTYRQKNKSTATLQHGLYVDYGNQHTVNVVNYQNVVSEYFLAWGEKTAQLISRYHPDCKLRICGKPTLSGTIEPNQESKTFTILFDQKMYKDYNQQLLDSAQIISKKMGWKIALRLHPTTFLKDYKTDPSVHLTTDPVPWEEIRFCIGHTTSMIYELLRRGMPVYKLQSKIPSHMLPDELCFTNASDLLIKLSRPVDFVSIGRMYVSTTGKQSLERYNKVLSEL